MFTLNLLRGLTALIVLLTLLGCDAARSANPTAPTFVPTTADINTTPAGPAPTASVDASSWTTEEWRAHFFSLVEQKGGDAVSDEGLWALRLELNPLGADFQNGWRGDIRPRLFLPVPDCPPATLADAPECAYSRTVDVGHYGDRWQWIIR